jgi:hypothetical protein
MNRISAQKDDSVQFLNLPDSFTFGWKFIAQVAVSI